MADSHALLHEVSAFIYILVDWYWLSGPISWITTEKKTSLFVGIYWQTRHVLDSSRLAVTNLIEDYAVEANIKRSSVSLGKLTSNPCNKGETWIGYSSEPCFALF